MLLIYIAVGGALGAVARYGLGGLVYGWAGAGFPWGTLAVNVVGSFALGLTLPFLEAVLVPPEIRAFVAIGFLGAFTTFSTFSYETVAMIQDGEWSRAALYALASVLLSLGGTFLGFAAAVAAVRTRS